MEEKETTCDLSIYGVSKKYGDQVVSRWHAHEVDAIVEYELLSSLQPTIEWKIQQSTLVGG